MTAHQLDQQLKLIPGGDLAYVKKSKIGDEMTTVSLGW